MGGEFDTRLKEVEDICKKEDLDKRVKHSYVELLRMDIEDKDNFAGKDKLIERLQQLRESLVFKIPKQFSPWMLLRALSGIVYLFIFATPLLTLFLMTRPFEPLLRSMGFKNNYLPIDMAQKWFARGCIAVCGVRVIPDGYEHVDTDKPTMCMYSHASNLDGPLVQAYSPVAFKYVAKTSIFMIPFFGWISWAYGNIPINRSNIKSAIASLEKARKTIQQKKQSLAISPEGTRSKTGQLAEFKKGSFHTALKVGLPITPVIFLNNYHCWPPGQLMPSRGLVGMRYLKPIPIQSDETVDTLRHKVRRAMLEAFKTIPPYCTDPNVAKHYRPGSDFINFLLMCSMLAYPFLLRTVWNEWL